jgi:hypothetical protein
MSWAINISRQNQKIKTILEEIDYELFAKYVEKVPFQNSAIVFPYSPDLRLYSARNSEDATKHPSQRPIACQSSKLKPRFEDSESRMRRISEIYNPIIILSLILLFLLIERPVVLVNESEWFGDQDMDFFSKTVSPPASTLRAIFVRQCP